MKEPAIAYGFKNLKDASNYDSLLHSANWMLQLSKTFLRQHKESKKQIMLALFLNFRLSSD